MNDRTKFELRKFVAPEIITGHNARLLVSRYIDHFESRKPLVVTDKNVRKLPWCQEILSEIRCRASSAVVFDDVTPNPKDYEAMAGARLFLAEHCDLIVAIGGGSPMDCAKCISIVSANGGHILDYEGVDEVNYPGPPLICIPSTCGSSADVSQFAIIFDSQNGIKKAIVSKKVVPDLALLDPAPLMTMDPYLIACTGMDALTHAIEAYVSNAQSELTDVHALEAIKLISDNLEAATAPDRTLDIMNQMMLGSIQAGLAFSNASLGAVHALSHSLGGLLSLPHGECNSILLEPIVELNYGCAAERFRLIAWMMGVATDNAPDTVVKKRLLSRIAFLRSNIGFPPVIHVPELSDDLLDRLVQGAINDPCLVTNPRQFTDQEVRAVYERILRL